jgi:hypothetical protein
VSAQLVTDEDKLKHLLHLLNERHVCCKGTMRLVRRDTRGRKWKVKRDVVMIAYRWLRRFAGGEWYRGGSHVARLNYGPMIALPERRVWFVDRRAP